MKQRRCKSKANNYLEKSRQIAEGHYYQLFTNWSLDHSVSIKISTRTCMEVKKSTMKFKWNSKGWRIANRPTLFFRESVGWNLPPHKMRRRKVRRRADKTGEWGRSHVHIYLVHHKTYIMCCVCHGKSFQSCLPLQPHRLQPSRPFCPWDSPGKSIGMGFHALVQVIFPTQGSNLSLQRLLHWVVGSLPLVPSAKSI